MGRRFTKPVLPPKKKQAGGEAIFISNKVDFKLTLIT
jgi:hypothetical protein